MNSMTLQQESIEESILRLSNEFSKNLRKAMSVKQMDLVIQRNRALRVSNLCATHDFCHADDIMYESFINVFGPAVKMGSKEDGIILNAWGLSIRSEF